MIIIQAIPQSISFPNGKKSYIAILERNPLIAYDDDKEGYQATKPPRGGKIDYSSNKVKNYRKFLKEKQVEAAEAAGILASDVQHQYTNVLNGIQAFMSEEQAGQLSEQEGVLLVIEDTLRHPVKALRQRKATESSPSFLGLNDPGGLWEKGYNGTGVVVGVIDSGIWPEHPSFADDGTYEPLPSFEGLPCEFGNTAHNPSDEPFTCNNKLLGASQIMPVYRFVVGADTSEFDSARDDDGHGSHTASTAAGNAGIMAEVLDIDRGEISGIANRARVIAYKSCGLFGCFTSDLAAAIDQAVEDGVDVINYSIGGGASSGIGADDISFLFAAYAGVFVATSAGNSGPSAVTVGSPATLPWITSVGASTQSRTFQGSAKSSAGDWEFFGASITAGTEELPLIDSTDAGSELCIPGDLDENKVAGKIVLCKRGAIARVAKSAAVYEAGGAGMMYVIV